MSNNTWYDTHCRSRCVYPVMDGFDSGFLKHSRTAFNALLVIEIVAEFTSRYDHSLPTYAIELQDL